MQNDNRKEGVGTVQYIHGRWKKVSGLYDAGRKGIRKCGTVVEGVI